MTLHSTAFSHDGAIPVKFTGEGEDVSPALSWNDVPNETVEFALICDDPDAPTPEPWVHWILYRIPGDVRALPEGVPPEPQLASLSGALQGLNSWPSGQTIGYRGPLPPKGHGVHHYHFRLYALDTRLPEVPSIDKHALLKLMENHILAEVKLTGTYQR